MRSTAMSWRGTAWPGGNDYDKAWLKLEGEYSEGDFTNRTELLWDRIIARRWSSQLGVRHDHYFGTGPSRAWAAFGVQGLAPYWFEIEATAYVGGEGRTAMRLSAEYELLMTQRLILQPRFELNVYGKDDPDNGIGSGLSDTELGLRLRYEIRRELAPYIGFSWTRLYGDTKDLERGLGGEDNALQFVAGVRAWF
jgi:copper resistance protein B